MGALCFDLKFVKKEISLHGNRFARNASQAKDEFDFVPTKKPRRDYAREMTSDVE